MSCHLASSPPLYAASRTILPHYTHTTVASREILHNTFYATAAGRIISPNMSTPLTVFITQPTPTHFHWHWPGPTANKVVYCHTCIPSSWADLLTGETNIQWLKIGLFKLQQGAFNTKGRLSFCPYPLSLSHTLIPYPIFPFLYAFIPFP